jgi:hypothetical protein
MDNVVTINNTKTNVLELDVSVQGIDTADIRVWLSVLAEGIELCFECTREGYGEKWVVTVPPLPFITRTAYPCAVKIVADGYYFEPLNGTMNVTGNAEVYSTTPQNIELKPADSEEKKEEKEEKVEEKITALPPGRQPKSRAREKSIAQLAKELMEKKGVPGQVNDDEKIIQIPVTKKAAEAQAKKLIEDEERERKSTMKSEDIDKLIEKIKADRQEEVTLTPPEEPPVIKDVEEAEEPVFDAPAEEPIVEEVVEEPVVEDEVIEEPIKEEVEEPVVEEVVEEPVVEEKSEETIEEDQVTEADPVVEAEVVEETDKAEPKDDAVKDILKTTKTKKRKKRRRKVQEKLDIPKKEIADFVPPKPAAAEPDQEAVKAILEDAKKKAKKYTKKKKPVPEIPKKDIADFKLKPRKLPESTKNDAIKAILEDMGVKLDESRPTKFIVRSKATRGEEGYDINEITKELIEKSEIDDAGVKKLEQLQEVVKSDKDSEVMAILEEIGIKPEGSKDVPRVSFIKKDKH